MKKLLALIAVVTLLFAGYAFARSAFEEAGDTAIESKKQIRKIEEVNFQVLNNPSRKEKNF